LSTPRVDRRGQEKRARCWAIEGVDMACLHHYLWAFAVIASPWVIR
jgi:hypothetical protein